MSLAPGVSAIPSADYHDDPCAAPSLSASIAHTLVTRSPLHAWTAHPKLNPKFARKEEAKFDVGTAAHAILLEGKRPEDVLEIIHEDSWRKNVAKEARDAARASGRVPLLVKDAEQVYEMIDAALAQLEAHEARPLPFTNGLPERTLVWDEGGMFCRALIDWLHDDHRFIDDYKTTSASADPGAWSRTLFTIGADVQTAFYLRGVQRLFGIHAEMRYIVQETYPPYALSVCSLSPAALEVGKHKLEAALRLWAKCLEADHWPAYPTRIAYAELPPWEEARWLERETLAGEAA